VRFGNRRLGLVREEVDGVCRVVPQEIVGPTSRLTQGIRVGASKEIRLYVHLLDGEFVPHDALMDPLVRRIEPARMSHHARKASLLGPCRDRERVAPTVGEGNLYLDMLSRVHGGEGLTGVELGGSGQDDRVDAVVTKYIVQLVRGERRTIGLSYFLGLFEATTDDARYLDAVY
jgi:hypothetical protein